MSLVICVRGKQPTTDSIVGLKMDSEAIRDKARSKNMTPVILKRSNKIARNFKATITYVCTFLWLKLLVLK